MSAPLDSDGIPFDESEFTASERARVRKLLEEQERLNWAKRKARILIPVFIALVGGMWSVIDWVLRHVKFNP